MVKNLPANAGDVRAADLIPRLRSPGGGHDSPLQYSGLEIFKKTLSNLRSLNFLL